MNTRAPGKVGRMSEQHGHAEAEIAGDLPRRLTAPHSAPGVNAFDAPAWLRLVLGATATFHGRHLPYLLLYAQVYRAHTRPFLIGVRRELSILAERLRGQAPQLQQATDASRDAINRICSLREAYMHTNAEGGSAAAAAVFQAELDELQRDLLRASRHGTSLVSGIDPNRLVNVMRTLSMGFIALAAKATADGARRLGVGIDVGQQLTRMVHIVTEPLIRRLVITLRCQSGERRSNA